MCCGSLDNNFCWKNNVEFVKIFLLKADLPEQEVWSVLSMKPPLHAQIRVPAVLIHICSQPPFAVVHSL